MTLPDVGPVVGGGIGSLLVPAILYPMWRLWLKRQMTEGVRADSEGGWMRRQADKIVEQERVITDLVKLRQTDAELIAALRLKEALAGERADRLMEHIERLNRRARRLEDVICDIRPDLAKWVRSDFAELGPAELEGPATIPTNHQDDTP